MKKALLFTVFVLISIAGFSQDLISLKNGTRLKAIVTEVTPTLVRYKLYDEPKGRVYFMYKEDVAGIMYQDGRVETFSKSDEQVIESSSKESENQQPSTTYRIQENVKPANQPSNNWNQTNSSVRSNNNMRNASTVGTKNEFQLILAMPQGKFSDNSTNRVVWLNSDGASSGAGTGFGIGYKLLSPLTSDGLYWTFSINAFYNDLSSDTKSDLDDKFVNYDNYNVPKYLDVPLMVGLQFERNIAEQLALYVEAGIGANILKITNYSFENSNSTTTITYKPAVSLAYKLGGGIVINNKYSIGLTYMDLGSYKIKYNRTYEPTTGDTQRTDGKLSKKLPVSLLNLTVGFRF
jgi:hypothetical protein